MILMKTQLPCHYIVPTELLLFLCFFSTNILFLTEHCKFGRGVAALGKDVYKHKALRLELGRSGGQCPPYTAKNAGIF